ncbi:MAG: AraC family transcriptional regulator [bacterium]|nr:AraC family transcriptional regulator [bacterium]
MSLAPPGRSVNNAGDRRHGYFSFEARVELSVDRDAQALSASAARPADNSGGAALFMILRWTRGAGRLRFENCETQIKALTFQGETLALLTPDARLEFEGDGPAPQIQGSRIAFNEDFLCAREDNAALLALDSAFYTQPLLRPTDAQGEILGRLHRDIAENQHDPEIARAYLKILLLKIQSFAQNADGAQDLDQDLNQDPTEEGGGDARRFQEFRRLVETNFRELHRPAQYAERMFLSTRCLNAITNARAGSSPSRIIQNRLLLEARRLLRSEDLTVTAVAREIGFADADYFGRFFHKHTGQTPGAFRKEAAKESSPVDSSG